MSYTVVVPLLNIANLTACIRALRAASEVPISGAK